MATWPDLTEYHEALQHPPRAFSDAGLKQASIELDKFGLPQPATGGNAVVYKGKDGVGTWAIRCFLRPISDHAERYQAISKHLRKINLASCARFAFLQDGIQIRGSWFPIVKMEWVNGDLFHRYIEKNLKSPKVLAKLRENLHLLIRQMESSKIAHGDLQHGNILVAQDKLLLVDYDGMWVPALKDRQATEIGHRAYQHPRRGQAHFGPYIDRFAALVLDLSIVALAQSPELWDEFHTGDNLIFVREDLKSPSKTPVWQSLAQLRSAEVDYLSAVLGEWVALQPEKLPSLDSVIKGSRKGKALNRGPAPNALGGQGGSSPPPLPAEPAAGPPSSKLPGWWASTGAGALSIAEVATTWKVIWSRPGERLETRWKNGPVPAKPPPPAPSPPPEQQPQSALKRNMLVSAMLGALIGWGFGWGLVADSPPAKPKPAVRGHRAAASAESPFHAEPWIAGVLGALGLGLAPVLIRRRGSSASVGALADDDEDDGSQLREQVTVKVPGMSSTVTAIQATADRKLTVVTKSGECGFWDPTADSFRAAQSKLPAFQVSALAQSAPRAIVASDHEVAVWDLSSWIKTPCPDDGASKIQSVAISPDGGRAVLGYGRSAIQVIDVVARKVTGELTGLSGQVTAMCVSDDGQQLLAGTGGGMVYLARFSPKLEKVAEAGGHSAAVRAVAAAPKCALFGSADDQGNVHVWSKDLKRVATAAACKAGVVSLCFVGKGELALAAGCADGTVKLVSPAGRVLASFSLGGSPVTAVSFSEPRAALAVGTADGKVALIGAE